MRAMRHSAVEIRIYALICAYTVYLIKASRLVSIYKKSYKAACLCMRTLSYIHNKNAAIRKQAKEN